MSDMTPVTEDVTMCPVHPDREATLRCNRCGRPMCTKCAVRTPTGYRCQDCIKDQQTKFVTMEARDPWLAGLTAMGLGFIFTLLASWIAPLLGLWGLLLIVFVGPTAGGITAEAIRRVVEKRRGPQIGYFAIGGAIVGALPMLLLGLFLTFFGNPFALLYPGAFVFVMCSTLYARLRGLAI